MAFSEFLRELKHSPHIVDLEVILSLSTFLKYIPQFKHDILLAQDSRRPPEKAPLFLPDLIAMLLANLCEISRDQVDSLWDYLKDCIWEPEERENETDARFRLHGKDLAYTSSATDPLDVHPPTQPNPTTQPNTDEPTPTDGPQRTRLQSATSRDSNPEGERQRRAFVEWELCGTDGGAGAKAREERGAVVVVVVAVVAGGWWCEG
ncbi:hypothetical protein B0H34DRAFT_802484 [Crassisporium funariophilum]|nr:hypothetical protein B0H34DRAFT_802484 [Crassisporium funariophilum]